MGLEEPPDPFLPQRHQVLFAVYSIAAAIYRWVVTLSIFWFLYEVLAPYGLKVISQMIATASIISLVAQPLWKVGKFFYIPGRLDKVKRKNLQATLAVMAVVALFIFALPLPHRVFCALEIKPRNAKMVYVEVPGQLKEVLVRPGQFVRQGTVLARLSNYDLELTVADLEGRREQYVAKLNGLRHAGSADEDAAAELPQIREMVKMVEDQLVQRRADIARLNLIAPIDGTVLPPAETPSRGGESAGELKGWSGTPFEVRNLGATLPESTLFCEIGDPHQMEADLVIEQDDLEFVHEDQPVVHQARSTPSSHLPQSNRGNREDRSQGHAQAFVQQGRRGHGHQDRRSVGDGKTFQYVVSSPGAGRRSRRRFGQRSQGEGQDFDQLANARSSGAAATCRGRSTSACSRRGRARFAPPAISRRGSPAAVW